jgi:hypothetical protein
VLVSGILTAAVLGVPRGGDAQIYFGAHAVHAADAFGGAMGAGVRAGVDLPVLPFDVIGSAEYFFPDCSNAQSDCKLHGVTLDGQVRMVLPVIRPYIVGGLAHRRFSAGGTDEDATGLAVGAGLDLALGGVRIFGEGRYEFLDAPEKQVVTRLGLMFGM